MNFQRIAQIANELDQLGFHKLAAELDAAMEQSQHLPPKEITKYVNNKTMNSIMGMIRHLQQKGKAVDVQTTEPNDPYRNAAKEATVFIHGFKTKLHLINAQQSIDSKVHREPLTIDTDIIRLIENVYEAWDHASMGVTSP